MWLLDANMPLQLTPFLRGVGVDVDSAIPRGWNQLRNGDLVSTAVQAGFDVLLTRDRLFDETAARVLSVYPDFCVVSVLLPQSRS